MIKVSKLTDYAVILLAEIANDQSESFSASSLATITHVPEPTTSKILKMLSKAGLLESTRGAYGGYKLLMSADELPMNRIIEAIDGPIALTACVEGSLDTCQKSASCSMNGRWNLLNDAIKQVIQETTLADMLAQPSLANSQSTPNIKIQSVEQTLKGANA